MKLFTHLNGVALLFILMPAAVNAQLGDVLKGGSKSLGGAGGALSAESLTSGSTGNVAGVLEFCIKNNFLGGNDALPVKDKLMGKLGGSPSTDSGYQDGAKGLLKSSNGNQFNLGGGGVQSEVTRQVCDKILAQGKSLL